MASTKEVTEGDTAPEFSLPSHQGGNVALKNFKGKKTVVLYFYPKDNTPGCTQEACEFRNAYGQFSENKAVLLGVSMDPIKSHQKFSEKHDLPFPLLSDETGAVSKKYGVYKQKLLYGRSFFGIERSTFVINRQGKIVRVFRRVKVKNHTQEVFEALKKGQKSTTQQSPSPKKARKTKGGRPRKKGKKEV